MSLNEPLFFFIIISKRSHSPIPGMTRNQIDRSHVIFTLDQFTEPQDNGEKKTVKDINNT